MQALESSPAQADVENCVLISASVEGGFPLLTAIGSHAGAAVGHQAWVSLPCRGTCCIRRCKTPI